MTHQSFIDNSRSHSQIASSDSLSSKRSKSISLLELWSALENETESRIDLGSFLGKPIVYDQNIAFSRKPRTEYDNIVNALTNLLLHYFVDKIEVLKCLAPDTTEEKSSVEEESRVFQEFFDEPPIRNPSSESFISFGSRESIFKDKHPSDNLDVFSSDISGPGSRKISTVDDDIIRIGINIPEISMSSNSMLHISKEESKVKEVFSSDSESKEDVNTPNYFSKYKGRDLNVTVEFKNGNKYEGRVSCFMMEGEGKYTWKDGTEFQGTFVNGIAQGRGHFLWPDKSWYNGEMKNNLRHGMGVSVIKKDEGIICYFGKWKNGQRNGKGVILFGEYDWYDGKWKNDKMHGYGLRQYPTGSRYLGEWKYGKPHEEGTMIWNHHDTYTGMWRKGKMHGRGTYTWRTFKTSNFIFPEQNVYDGYWKNGKRHGAGRLLLASGAIISTVWMNDLKEGPGQIICKNGLVLESPFFFTRDKLCNIGRPIVVPPWNKWYYDFLLPYQDGIVAPFDIECESCYVYQEFEKQIGNISSKMPLGTKRKMCLNNIPLLAPVETMPLWKFIEMSFEEQGTITSQNNNLYVTEEVMKNMSFEELWLRKVLSNRMPDISIVYQHYAKIGCEETPSYNCFLLRIMLWQMCLDCELKNSSFTLCSLDNELGFGSYPFDIVPMFQMINYLLILTYDLCIKNGLVNKNIPGLWGGALDFFISNLALPAMKKKNPFSYLCIQLPLKELYSTFYAIGNPVTVSKIMKIFAFYYEEEEEVSYTWPGLTLKLPILKHGQNLIYPDGSVVFELNKVTDGETQGQSQYTDDYLEFSELAILGDQIIKEHLLSSCSIEGEYSNLIKAYEISFLEFCYFISTLLSEYRILVANLEGDINECNMEEETVKMGSTVNVKQRTEKVLFNTLTKDGKSHRRDLDIYAEQCKKKGKHPSSESITSSCTFDGNNEVGTNEEMHEAPQSNFLSDCSISNTQKELVSRNEEMYNKLRIKKSQVSVLGKATNKLDSAKNGCSFNSLPSYITKEEVNKREISKSENGIIKPKIRNKYHSSQKTEGHNISSIKNSNFDKINEKNIKSIEFSGIQRVKTNKENNNLTLNTIESKNGSDVYSAVNASITSQMNIMSKSNLKSDNMNISTSEIGKNNDNTYYHMTLNTCSKQSSHIYVNECDSEETKNKTIEGFREKLLSRSIGFDKTDFRNTIYGIKKQGKNYLNAKKTIND